MHRLGHAAAAATLLLAALCMGGAQAANETISEEPYVIGGWLAHFVSRGDQPVSLTQAYIIQAAIGTVVIIVIGIIATIVFIWWSACGCGCCPCCPKDGSVNCCCLGEGISKWIYILLAIGCAGAALGMAWFGLQVSARQGEAIASLPTLANNVEAYAAQIDEAVQVILSDVRDAVSILEKEPFLTQQPALAAEVSEQIGDLNDIMSNSSEANSIANNLQLDKISGQFTSQIETVDEYRDLGMKILLGFLMGIILIQIIIALMDLFCSDSLKPRKCCLGKLLAGIMTSLAILALFLIWLLSGILFAVSTITADVCADPGNVISLADAPDTLNYFLSCSSLTEAEQLEQSPFKDVILALQDLDTEIDQGFNDIIAGCSVHPACDQPEIDLAASRDKITTVPLQELMGCEALNGKWNAVANLLCGNFGESLAETTVVMLAFSIILLISEVVRRKVQDIEHGSDSKVV